jgi:hypothetical protein
LPVGDYDPPKFAVPTLVVDTTQGYRPQLEAIVSFACGNDVAETTAG